MRGDGVAQRIRRGQPQIRIQLLGFLVHPAAPAGRRREVAVDLDIHPQARAQPGDLVVSVVDTGLGIAPADQPKVFERFKQVGDTLTDKPKGTGLGLPICREIVEHHGGRIWVESQPGQGATFYFTLPKAKG